MKEIQIQFSYTDAEFSPDTIRITSKEEINIVESDILSVFLSHSARIFVYVTNANSEM